MGRGQAVFPIVAHGLLGIGGLSFLARSGVCRHLRTGTPHEVIAYQWIFGGDLTINLAYLVDPLTCSCGSSSRSRVPDPRYSVGYMQ